MFNLRRFSSMLSHAMTMLSVIYNTTPVNGGLVILQYVSAVNPTPTTTDPADIPFSRPSISLEYSGTILASEIGSGQNEATMFEIKQIASRYILHYPTKTVTHVTEPVTRTWIEEHGASVVKATMAPLIVPAIRGNSIGESSEISLSGININETCVVDRGQGTGECVVESESQYLVTDDDGSGGDVTTIGTETFRMTYTYTGPLAPFVTGTTRGRVGARLGLKGLVGSVTVVLR